MDVHEEAALDSSVDLSQSDINFKVIPQRKSLLDFLNPAKSANDTETLPVRLSHDLSHEGADEQDENSLLIDDQDVSAEFIEQSRVEEDLLQTDSALHYHDSTELHTIDNELDSSSSMVSEYTKDVSKIFEPVHRTFSTNDGVLSSQSSPHPSTASQPSFGFSSSFSVTQSLAQLRINDMQTQCQKEIEDMKTQHQKQLLEIQSQNQRQLEQLQSKYNKQIQLLTDENGKLLKDIEQIDLEKEKELDKLDLQSKQLINKLKNDNLELNERIHQLEHNKHGSLDKYNEMERLSDEMNHLAKERDEYERKADKSRNDLEQARMELNKFKLENGKFKSDLESLEMKRKEEVYRLETEMEKRMNISEQKLQEMDVDIQRLAEQNRQLQLDLSDRNQFINKLKDDVMLQERQLVQLDNDNIQLRRKLNDIDQLENEVQQYRRRIKVLENDLNDSLSANSQLKSQLQTTRMSISSSSSRFDNFDSGYNRRSNAGGSYDDDHRYVGSSSIGVGSSTSRFSVDTGDALLSESRFQRSNPNPNDYSNDRSLNSSSVSSRFTPRLSEETLSQNSTSTSVANSRGLTSSGPKTLASLVGVNPGTSPGATVSAPVQSRRAGGTPFATKQSLQQMSTYDDLDRQLTNLMTEKSALTEESSKLFQRGGKTLKERNRLAQIDGRLDELKIEISTTRKNLASKPA